MSWFEIALLEAYHMFNVPVGLIAGRIFIASVVLSVFIGLIICARRKCVPSIRSWLWGLCVPIMMLPFERGIVALVKAFGDIYVYNGYSPNLNIFNWISGLFPEIGMDFYKNVSLLLPLLPYIWLIGVVVRLIVMRRSFKKTLRLIKSGGIQGCAAYFYKGHSHIYTPPDFTAAYSDRERNILLAHERQHINQLDTLLYKFLGFVECVFWFNPLIYKATKLVRHDRELLCDQRVMRHFSKHDYGVLLLNEAKRAVPSYGIAGIISEPSGVYERVTACVKPLSKKICAALFITTAAVVLFAVGIIGQVTPAVENPKQVLAYTVNVVGGKDTVTPAEGLEKFISVEEDGYYLDEEGFYKEAVSMGFAEDQEMAMSVTHGMRQTLISVFSHGAMARFLLSDIKTKEIFISFSEIELDLSMILMKLL